MKTERQKLLDKIRDNGRTITFYRPANKYLFVKDYIEYYGKALILVRYVSPVTPDTNFKRNVINDLAFDDAYSVNQINRIRLLNRSGKEKYFSTHLDFVDFQYKFPLSKIKATGCVEKDTLTSTLLSMIDYDNKNRLDIYGIIPLKNEKVVNLTQFDPIF
jgi:hypothetical protein